MRIYRSRLLSLLCALTLLVPLSVSAQTESSTPQISMTVSLANQVPRQGVISTARTDVQQLRVMNGSTVSLTRNSGSDYQLQSAGGWSWNQVQQVPANMESMTLTPTLLEGGAVSVEISMTNKSGNRGMSYQSTVLVPADQWVQLYGDAPPPGRGTKTYSTKTQSTDQLFIYVTF